MAIITLTTDFGEKDYFVGALKGAIFSELESVRVVDISHNVSPFNILEAAYIIKNAYQYFPKGSIHIIDIDSEYSIENKHIALKIDDHFFVGTNNGVLSMICEEIVPENIVEITVGTSKNRSFASLDVFVKVACHIARGGTLEVIWKRIENIKPIINLKPFVDNANKQIIGSVIYIDNYGNVITNITKSFFDRVRKTRAYEISVRNYKFKRIYNSYNAVVNFEIEALQRQDEGKALVLFNAAQYLEISVYKSNSNTVGSASTLMGLKFMDTVTINFS